MPCLWMRSVNPIVADTPVPYPQKKIKKENVGILLQATRWHGVRLSSIFLARILWRGGKDGIATLNQMPLGENKIARSV